MAEFLENPEELLNKAKESKTLKIASIVVGGIALLAIVWFSYKQFIFGPANEKSKTAYWRAMVFLENEEPEKALEEFVRVAKQFDGKIGGEISQYMAGRLYMDQGEFKTALNYLSKAKVNDLYVATLIIGLLAIFLGLIFKGQNVAFMVGLAFAIAASANFPSLVLSILWKKFTTKGAVASIFTGTGLAIILIILSPTVWVDILHNEAAIFPLKNPALFSMTTAFIVGVIVSLLTPEKEAQDKFEDEKLRTYLGIGAE